VIFIRVLKLLTLLYETETMRKAFETLRNLAAPISYLIAVVGIVMYEFSVLGMYMFGGLVASNTP
jgi:hypothetical protein